MKNQIKIVFDQGKKAPIEVDLLDFLFNSNGNGNQRAIDLPGGEVAQVDIRNYSLKSVEVEETAPATEAPAAAAAEGEQAPADTEQQPAAEQPAEAAIPTPAAAEIAPAKPKGKGK